MQSKYESKSCPSSTCSEGALLLGKVKQDGTIGFLETKLQLDSSATEAFHQAGNPERHFRFSSGCVQNGCRQWNQGNCTVIKKVLNVLADELPSDAPSCLIRSTCRWYYQEGVSACYACSYIVADVGIETMQSTNDQ